MGTMMAKNAVPIRKTFHEIMWEKVSAAIVTKTKLSIMKKVFKFIVLPPFVRLVVLSIVLRRVA